MGTLGNARPGDGVVVVAETGDGRLVHEVLAGRGPPAPTGPAAAGDGGPDPDPYELLLMSLGACTAVALRRYADGEGWPLGCVTVRLRHARAHAEDSAGCEGDLATLDRIERTVDLPGPLNAAQRTRLMRVADMCPLRRALARGVEVRTIPARSGPD